MSMQILEFDIFSKYPDLKYGVSTKVFGTMKNADGSINRENLNNFLKQLGLNEEAVCMAQVHGRNIEEVNSTNSLLISNTDGLITNKKNIALCILTADCLPIIFFDPQKKVIGALHAGRKGIIKGIIENIIEKFIAVYHSDTKDIIVGIGPGIEKKCYEVDGKLMDIRNMAHELLVGNGILKDHIEDMEICTRCNPKNYYSYRGGDNFQRFSSVISMI